MFVKPTTALCLIDLGRPWYARCVSESPSTIITGALTASPSARGSPTSGGRSRSSRPHEAPASGGRRARQGLRRRRAVARAVGSGRSRDRRGTSGTPAARATRAAPVCGRALNFLTKPFSRRVPSGKIATTSPSRASLTAVSIAFSSPSPRLTLNAPPNLRIGQSGERKSSAFAMNRSSRCGKRGQPSGHGSRLDTWLAERT